MPAEPIRVLMTTGTVGGVWTFAIDLARALGARRVRTVLATMGRLPTDAQRREAQAVPHLELVASEFRLEWMDDPWEHVAAAGDWLLALEGRVEPDVVHLNGYAHGSVPFRAPVVVAGHGCLRSWAEAVPGVIPEETLAAYHERVAAGVKAARVVVAPSRAMLRSLEQHYGPLGRTMVVYNGRRDGLFVPGRKEPFVFAAGRLWDRAKNAEALTAVAPRLPWPVSVAGETARERSATPVPLPGVRALGPLDPPELAGWLGRASIFALPVRYEPFGVLQLEAALSGCALVLGDIPSQREIWGEAADFVPPDDHDALRETIAALIASPQRLRLRAEAARARAARYTVDRMAQGYLDAYQQAAALRRRQSAAVS